MRNASMTLATFATIALSVSIAPAALAETVGPDGILVTHEAEVELQELPSLEPTSARQANVDRALAARLDARNAQSATVGHASPGWLAGLQHWLAGGGDDARRQPRDAEHERP